MTNNKQGEVVTYITVLHYTYYRGQVIKFLCKVKTQKLTEKLKLQAYLIDTAAMMRFITYYS